MNPVDIGDLVCAVSLGEGNAATRIHVIPRQVIKERQQRFLAEWQKNSLYGNVEGIDPTSHVLTVMSIGSTRADRVRVELGSNVRFRTFPSNATSVQDAKAFRAEDLRTGERVYVWGTRRAGSNVVDAKIVAAGGVRAMVGTIIAIQPLTSTVKIREFESHRALDVKLGASQLYRTAPAITSPAEIAIPAGVPLANVGLADVGSGDSVLVIGRGEGTDVVALIMITAFGSFGVEAGDPSSQLTWVLK
jgi:hypothetical protein